MISKRILWSFIAGGLLSMPFGHGASKIAPVPGDPLELAAGQVVGSVSRKAALDLLARARENYDLRKPGLGYHLKVNFAVDSLGQTDLDGVWDLEDLYIPGRGLHWTAHAASGYDITGISSHGELYGEATPRSVPLRLEEVRGMLLHPLPSPAYADRESIRTSTATFRGATVTCVLLSSPSQKAVIPPVGRAWEESEECVDPQSGLLQIHSEVPGRYVLYDYSNAPQLDGHTLPRTVTINEGGRIVSTITVEKLEEIKTADSTLFAPTDRMRARGRFLELGTMEKISRAHGPFTLATTVRPVCVFGVVTATGRLVEAHSLQPSDPNSQAAVEWAKRLKFSTPSPRSGARPQQHFVFLIANFVSSK